MQVVIQPSRSKAKKMDAIIDGKKTVHFGQKNASDFTRHRDPERKERYISRRKGMHENWTKYCIKTPSFYARWILWNKPA